MSAFNLGLTGRRPPSAAAGGCLLPRPAGAVRSAAATVPASAAALAVVAPSAAPPSAATTPAASSAAPPPHPPLHPQPHPPPRPPPHSRLASDLGCPLAWPPFWPPFWLLSCRARASWRPLRRLKRSSFSSSFSSIVPEPSAEGVEQRAPSFRRLQPQLRQRAHELLLETVPSPSTSHCRKSSTTRAPLRANASRSCAYPPARRPLPARRAPPRTWRLAPRHRPLAALGCRSWRAPACARRRRRGEALSLSRRSRPG